MRSSSVYASICSERNRTVLVASVFLELRRSAMKTTATMLGTWATSTGSVPVNDTEITLASRYVRSIESLAMRSWTASP